MEALGVRAVAFGSLLEATDAGHGGAVDASANGVGMEVLLLAVDVSPRAEAKRKASGGGTRTEVEAEGAGMGGSGGSVFSPGMGEIVEVAKRGWRRCSYEDDHD